MDFVAFLLVSLAVSIPVDVSIATWHASSEHGVDPYTMAAYLVTEHPGGRYGDECSDAGACGPFQLVRLWETEFGGDRHDPNDAAAIFAQLVLYAEDKHGDKWRAAIKCAPAARSECEAHTKLWVRTESRLRDLGDSFLVEHPMEAHVAAVLRLVDTAMLD